MIPQTAIHFNPDDTAWYVSLAANEPYSIGDQDRPCNTCHGARYDRALAPCPDCDGTGRHTFEIKVQDTEYPEEWHFTYRVSIMPNMILEITSGIDAEYRPMVWVSSEGVAWLLVEGMPSIIILPPDARPGMWIVLLKVHQ